MMRFQFARNYLFIFDNNDGRGREVTGQIELSDDGGALAFGEQVIRQMMQVASHWELSRPFSPWHIGLPYMRNCHGMDAVQDHVTQGGDREPTRSSFSARSHRNDEAGS
jgi:hypothetical protein